MSESTIQGALESLRASVQAVRAAPSEQELERLRIELLGRKGALKGLMARIPELAPAERAGFGKRLNELKAELERAFAERRQQLAAQAEQQRAAGFFDPTLPGTPPPRGSLHPLTRMTEELLEVFGRLGFELARGPEVEVPFYNFEALNIPPEHPARDPTENFFLEQQSEQGPLLLRSQTSTIQIRVMKERKPPLRVVAPGRVFRPDTVDATHHFQFHQIEGLAVEQGLSFADLKSVLLLFAQELFGEGQQVRLRPSFFPFTEPSAEMDFLCWSCRGAGCAMCKQVGWIELGGCGMVDPNVLEAVEIDPERYTGYAFGLGIERLAMLRHGIGDLRLFTDNDVRFLEQLG
ncbi:MAG: phenylalanine--tRNA ligase alpha subunit [Planctomycetota bacterium]|nr:MAG: phenylalanine--tRNA ligase alpha subunit [Planctomycetota bacterium]